MAAALPGIAVGLTALGMVSQASAEKRVANSQEQAAHFNAGLAQRDAAMTRDQAKADIALLEREKFRNIGAARAQYGASGVTLDGSPLDVLEQSAYNAELDKQTVLYKSEVEATGYTDSATLERMRGTNARREGNIRAGSAILTGSAKIADRLPRGTGYAVNSGTELGDYSYDSTGLA